MGLPLKRFRLFSHLYSNQTCSFGCAHLGFYSGFPETENKLRSMLFWNCLGQSIPRVRKLRGTNRAPENSSESNEKGGLGKITESGVPTTWIQKLHS